MAGKQVILTVDGLAKLEAELEELKTVKRKEVAEKIKVALSFGDLSENSEYDEAKNEQAMVEARIVQIETMLKNVKVLDDDELNTETVNVGSKIKIKDLEYDEVLEYHLVGSTEADPTKGKISDESPVGKALLEMCIRDSDNLGIARLIYQLPTTLCETYLREVFKRGSIESLDYETLFTIQKFFENNLNFSETSRKLFVHRNTLVYRLEKIKKLTGLDLREFDHAIIFKIALMVKKYLTSNPVKF